MRYLPVWCWSRQRNLVIGWTYKISKFAAQRRNHIADIITKNSHIGKGRQAHESIMKTLNDFDLVVLSRHFFRGLNSVIGTARFWIGSKILPKDVTKFTHLILSKLSDDIQKMDSDKIKKITSIKVDFEFREWYNRGMTMNTYISRI